MQQVLGGEVSEWLRDVAGVGVYGGSTARDMAQDV